MSRRVALVRTDVSEELNASFIRVTRIGELGTTRAVTSNRRTLQIYRNGDVLIRMMLCSVSSSESAASNSTYLADHTLLFSQQQETQARYRAHDCILICNPQPLLFFWVQTIATSAAICFRTAVIYMLTASVV
jgi:hypothetical protein